MTVTRSDSDAVAESISILVDRGDLSEPLAYRVADDIMQGNVSPARIAALLVALRMKGETVDEISGFVRAMRDRSSRLVVSGDSVLDTCGTGGDARGTFNISTVCAFIAAGAGVRVAKHGNRSVSSLCGSAEVIEALGLGVETAPQEAARQLDEIGLTFLYAPLYHRATRHAAGPRKEIGVRSIFNIVGPLTNPAGAKRQLLGVFDGRLTEPLARVLQRLGSTHCMVVHGEDGLDEITLSGKTRVTELDNASIQTYDLEPESLGFSRQPLDRIRGGDAATNAGLALNVLRGEPGPAREICLLNAGAAIYVSGVAASIEEGIAAARQSIDSGSALVKLERLKAWGGERGG